MRGIYEIAILQFFISCKYYMESGQYIPTLEADVYIYLIRREKEAEGVVPSFAINIYRRVKSRSKTIISPDCDIHKHRPCARARANVIQAGIYILQQLALQCLWAKFYGKNSGTTWRFLRFLRPGARSFTATPHKRFCRAEKLTLIFPGRP